MELFLRNLTYFFTAEGSTAAAGAATAKAKKPAAKAAGMQAGGQVVFVDWFTGPVLHQLPSSDEVELMVRVLLVPVCTQCVVELTL